MGLLKMKTRVLAKKEATYGTDAAPTTSQDGIACYDPAVTFVDEVINRKLVTGSFSESEPQWNRSYATSSLSVELKGSGTAGTAPEWGPLLQACGFSETIVTNTSVTYQPVTGGEASVTMWCYKDGNLYKMTGARGNARFMRSVGGVPMIEFSFTGLRPDPETNPSQASFPATISLDNTKPVASSSSTFTFAGNDYNVAGWELDMGNNVGEPNPSLNAALGYSEAQIKGRSPSGSFDPEERADAMNIQNLVPANAAHAFAWANGGEAGNRIAISCPKCVLMETAPGDRDGINTYAANFVPAMDSGDDEIVVTLT